MSTLLHWWTSVISKIRSGNRSIKSTEIGMYSEVTLRKTIQIRSSIHRARIVCVITDGRKSRGCQFNSTYMCRTSSRRSICLHSSKDGGRPEMCIRLPRHKSLKSWSNWKDPVDALYRKFVRIFTCRFLWRKKIGESSFDNSMGNFYLNWQHLFVQRNKIYSYLYTWMSSKLQGEKKCDFQFERNWWRMMTSFLDHIYLRCTQRECKSNEITIDQYTLINVPITIFLEQ